MPAAGIAARPLTAPRMDATKFRTSPQETRFERPLDSFHLPFQTADALWFRFFENDMGHSDLL
jgi:hypothetical protein